MINVGLTSILSFKTLFLIFFRFAMAGTENTAANQDPVVFGEDGKPLSKAQLKKLQKKQEKEAQKQATQDRLVKYN